tara:strand:+ start:16293 stop:17459 length:1167 start_codon:yes stop_codon:yes gene_type:complete
MPSKKICVVTGTRADYGLLRWVMEGIKKSEKLDLQIIVTGSHLSPQFGLTYHEIENDGFLINKKIHMLISSDTPECVSKSMGIATIGFSDALQELNPDLLLVLGDRFEIFSAAGAAMIARVPIAHLHGGESTEGSIDEAIRHSVSKMSHLHFVATEKYKKRVIQLGEHPDRVFNVGGLGIDNINKLNLLSKNTLEDEINFEFGIKNLLVTYHPETLEHDKSKLYMKELLHVLDRLKNTKIIFTMPNADAGYRDLFELINNFTKKHTHSIAFNSLGYLKYLSCIQFVDGVIGNSSSGIIEVPSFKKGTINIGERQRGRIKASSIIDCEANRLSISKGIQTLYSEDFQNNLENLVNPYGNGGASKAITKILEDFPLKNILKKEFYSLDIK